MLRTKTHNNESIIVCFLFDFEESVMVFGLYYDTGASFYSSFFSVFPKKCFSNGLGTPSNMYVIAGYYSFTMLYSEFAKFS